MSVASSDFPVLSYATTALTAQASAASTYGTAFTQVVPAGKYLVTGSLNAIGANLLTVSMRTSSGTAVEFADIEVATGATLTVYKAPFAVIHESTGSNAFVASIACSTSAGTWASSAGIPIKFKLL